MTLTLNDLAAVMDWLNKWGNVDEPREVARSRDYRDGYEQAIRDVYARLDLLFNDWPAYLAEARLSSGPLAPAVAEALPGQELEQDAQQ